MLLFFLLQELNEFKLKKFTVGARWDMVNAKLAILQRIEEKNALYLSLLESCQSVAVPSQCEDSRIIDTNKVSIMKEEKDQLLKENENDFDEVELLITSALTNL